MAEDKLSAGQMHTVEGLGPVRPRRPVTPEFSRPSEWDVHFYLLAGNREYPVGEGVDPINRHRASRRSPLLAGTYDQIVQGVLVVDLLNDALCIGKEVIFPYPFQCFHRPVLPVDQVLPQRALPHFTSHHHIIAARTDTHELHGSRFWTGWDCRLHSAERHRRFHALSGRGHGAGR